MSQKHHKRLFSGDAHLSAPNKLSTLRPINHSPSITNEGSMHIRLGFGDAPWGLVLSKDGLWAEVEPACGQLSGEQDRVSGVHCYLLARSEAELLTHSWQVKVLVAIYYICHHAGINQLGHIPPSSLIVIWAWTSPRPLIG